MGSDGIGRAVARAVVGVIGSGIAGVIVSAFALREWAVESLRDHPAEFVLGFLVSAAFGGSLAFFACGIVAERRAEESSERERKLESRVEELEGRPTREHLDDLRSRADRLEAALEDAQRRAGIVPGLSKAASDVHHRLEERDLDAVRALAAVCASGDDGRPATPLVMSLGPAWLSSVSLDPDGLTRLADLGVLRLHQPDDHVVFLGAQEREGQVSPGVWLGPDAVRVRLGPEEASMPRKRISPGTDIYVATGVTGADLGVVELTDAGREIVTRESSGEVADGLAGALAEWYGSEGITFSRHSFRVA